MTDVLCIGVAVVDILAAGIPEREAWKEKQRISQIRMMIGGDAANQSIRMADAGMKVKLSAAVGSDTNGDFLLRTLKERQIDTDTIKEKISHATGTALVLVDETGERHIFSARGAHSMLEKEDLPDLSMLKEQGLRALSIGSLFCLTILEEDGLKEYLREAKRLHILTFADLGSDKKKQGLNGIREFLPYIDFFLPSDYDVRQLTKENNIDKAAELLLDCGCEHLIVKCGKEGCRYYSKVENFQIPAPQVDALDTTGAGDCLAALFVTRILLGDSVREACRYACVGASLSTLQYGAAAKRLEHKKIEQILSRQKEEEP